MSSEPDPIPTETPSVAVRRQQFSRHRTSSLGSSSEGMGHRGPGTEPPTMHGTAPARAAAIRTDGSDPSYHRYSRRSSGTAADGSPAMRTDGSPAMRTDGSPAMRTDGSPAVAVGTDGSPAAPGGNPPLLCVADPHVLSAPSERRVLQRRVTAGQDDPCAKERTHPRAPRHTSRHIFIAIACIVAGTGCLLFGLAVYFMNGSSDPKETVRYPRLANKRMSDGCRAVTDDEMLAGQTRSNVVLAELAASLRYHARAHRWRGMCAQHLADAPPLCFCVLLLEDLDAGQAPDDSSYVAVSNMYIYDVSDQTDVWHEDTPFCGEQYVTRADAVRAYYKTVGLKDGRPAVRAHRAYFENELAVEVQSLDDVMHAADLCVSEPVGRLMNQMMLRMQRAQGYEPRTAFELSGTGEHREENARTLRAPPQGR